MIIVLNPNKLTRQLFFQDLINYLNTHEAIILRQIKRDFPQVQNLERSIEDYVQAGYILRQDKHYYLNVPLLRNADQVALDDMIFIEDQSPAYQVLLKREFETHLTNTTNQAILVEKTDFERTSLGLANYFHKLKVGQPLTQEQERIYAILGDVNQEYALKYMTTFLLKFGRKMQVPQKRPDIFVQVLELLGYIEKNADDKYELKLSFDSEKLIFAQS
ncbi:DUF1803 domain-containing protein [Streptococcus dentapri]|uniref:DUF1803 domain-containing protein n=1 Tax=Streptococcus dentapri TaxID=573564 RepID=A0ABV8D2L5_9STRE